MACRICAVSAPPKLFFLEPVHRPLDWLAKVYATCIESTLSVGESVSVYVICTYRSYSNIRKWRCNGWKLLIGRLVDWKIGWQVGWQLVNWQIVRYGGWQIGWQVGWQIGWLADWLTDWLANWWLADWFGAEAHLKPADTWLLDWLTGRYGRLFEWQIGSEIGWVADWLVDCLIGYWIADWLADWLRQKADSTNWHLV